MWLKCITIISVLSEIYYNNQTMPTKYHKRTGRLLLIFINFANSLWTFIQLSLSFHPHCARQSFPLYRLLALYIHRVYPTKGRSIAHAVANLAIYCLHKETETRRGQIPGIKIEMQAKKQHAHSKRALYRLSALQIEWMREYHELLDVSD